MSYYSIIKLNKEKFGNQMSSCDKVCQWLSTGRWFSSTNKTDRHDIIEILLKVALNTISLNLNQMPSTIFTVTDDGGFNQLMGSQTTFLCILSK
jgi:hypothetical protein